MDSDELRLPAKCLTNPIETLGLPKKCIPTPKAVPAANQLAFLLTAAALTVKENMPRLTAHGWYQALVTLAYMKSSAEFTASEMESAAAYGALLTPDRFRSDVFSSIEFENDFDKADHAWFDAMTAVQFLSLICVFNQSEKINIADETSLRELLSGIFDMPLECVFSDDPSAIDLWKLVWLEKVSDAHYSAHFDYNNEYMAKLDVVLLNDSEVYVSDFETMEYRSLIEPNSDLRHHLFDIALPAVSKAVESAED